MKSTIFFKNTTPELILAFLFSASIGLADYVECQRGQTLITVRKYAGYRNFPEYSDTVIAYYTYMSPRMTKPTKWHVCPAKITSAWASAQSDQGLCSPHEECLGL